MSKDGKSYKDDIVGCVDSSDPLCVNSNLNINKRKNTDYNYYNSNRT